MLTPGSEIAVSTDRGEAIVDDMEDRLRRNPIVLPSALERLPLLVRAPALKAAHARLIRDCSTEQIVMLEHLIAPDRSPDPYP